MLGGRGKKVLEFVLKGDDKTKGAFGSLQANVKKFMGSTLGIATAIGATVVAAGVMAKKLGQAYGSVIKHAGKYQKAVAEINTLMNASDETVTAMATDLQELAVRFGQVDTVMARAQYNVVSAGFNDVADSMEILTVASKAAIGGISDVNTAARVITQTLNAYGKSADEAEEIAGILFATVKGGVTTFEELAGYLGKVTASASVAGISFEEVSAAMAVMTKNGINTAESATALNSLIIALGAATGESKAKLDALGITLDDGLAPALAAIDAAGGDSLMTLREMVPNIRALKAAASAGANGAKAMTDQLALMTEGVSDFNAAYTIMSKTLDLANARLGAAQSRLKTAAGNTGVEGMTAATNGLAEALNTLAVGIEGNTQGMTTFNRQTGQLVGWMTAGSTSGDHFAVKLADAGIAMSKLGRLVDAMHSTLELLGVDFDNTADEAVKAKAALDDLSDADPNLVTFGDMMPDLDGYVNQMTAGAEMAAAETARAAIEAAAAEWGVATTETIFDPAELKWIDKDIAAEDIAAAIAEAYQEAIDTKVDLPPLPIKTYAAAPSEREDTDVTGGEIMLLEDILAKEQEIADARAVMSDAEFEAHLVRADMQRENLAAAEESLAKMDEQKAKQEELANTVAQMGANFERLASNSLSAMLQGKDGAIMFGRALKGVVMDALSAVLARMLAIQAVKLFSGLGFVPGLKDGGTVPGLAFGGTIPRAAQGYAVPDGPRGRDSRLIAAMPGEEVIKRSLSQRLDRFLVSNESAAMASPFDIDAGGGRGDVSLTMQVARPMSYLDALDLGESAAVAAQQVQESEL